MLHVEKFGRKGGEKVHAAVRIGLLPRYYKLACTGRVMTGMLPTEAAVTCKACLKGIESGRIA